jgi:putative transposase
MTRQPPVLLRTGFATVRHRMTRAKGCLSHDTGMIMVFKLIFAAQSSSRRLDGQNQLPKVITGVTFTDGIEAGHENAAA